MIKASESGIIKSSPVTSKISSTGQVVNPMNAEQYRRMKNGLNRIGCSVISATGGDDLAYLRWLEAEAISDSHGIMHMGEIPSASAFFEEVIHFQQYRKFGEIEGDDMFIERAAREIAANQKLLKHGKA